MRTPVYLDYLQANQLIAAADARQHILESKARTIVAFGGEVPDALSRAIVDCISAEIALRAAFDTIRDILADEPEQFGDVPLALHIYQAEGR